MKKYAILVYIGISMRICTSFVAYYAPIFTNWSMGNASPIDYTNGFQFKGVVKGFDNYTVILDTDGKQNLIYKHAISTITPLKPISILDAYEKAEEE